MVDKTAFSRVERVEVAALTPDDSISYSTPKDLTMEDLLKQGNFNPEAAKAALTAANKPYVFPLAREAYAGIYKKTNQKGMDLSKEEMANGTTLTPENYAIYDSLKNIGNDDLRDAKNKLHNTLNSLDTASRNSILARLMEHGAYQHQLPNGSKKGANLLAAVRGSFPETDNIRFQTSKDNTHPPLTFNELLKNGMHPKLPEMGSSPQQDAINQNTLSGGWSSDSIAALDKRVNEIRQQQPAKKQSIQH